MKKNTPQIMLYVVSALLAACIITLLIFWMTHRGNTSVSPSIPPALSEDPDVTVVYRDVNRFTEVEKSISASMIEESLKDMGVLITQEYDFTEVISFSSIRQLFGLDLGFTESSYLCSYDGVVTAGIDFSAIRVEKDDEKEIITIYIPGAALQNIDIDPNSFVLYEEKNGLGNPISITDFNRSLIELENNARSKALDKGILQKADENARSLIRYFIGSMMDVSAYTIEFVTQ